MPLRRRTQRAFCRLWSGVAWAAAAAPAGFAPARAAAAQVVPAPGGAGRAAAASPTDTAALGRFLAAYADGGYLHGAILVAEHVGTPRERVVYARGFGTADLAWGVPSTDRTAYGIASVTKQFTALLVLRAVERRALRLDAPVGTYLPELASAAVRDVTLHQLLSHRAGLPHYEDGLPQLGLTFDQYARTPYTSAELLALIGRLRLVAPPGTAHQYSSFGYMLLGLVLERVAGKSFAQLVREEITLPLGMAASGVEAAGEVAPRLAEPYRYRWARGADGTPLIGYAPAPPRAPATTHATGGVYSTVHDLLAWDRAVLTHRLLRPASTAHLFAAHSAGLDARRHGYASYGYGWILDPRFEIDSAQGLTVGVRRHSGGGSGYTASNTIVNGGEVVIITLENQDAVTGPFLTRNVVRILRGLPVTPPRAQGPPRIARALVSAGPAAARAVFDSARAHPDVYSLHASDFLAAGARLLEMRLPRQAAALYALGTAAHPESAALHEAQGDAQTQAGDPDAARRAFGRALALWGSDPASQARRRALESKLARMR